MSANGISTLATKELRQKAKLNLASADRKAINLGSNTRYEYDITELPTQYYGNRVENNPNLGGLTLGRPWIFGSPTYLYADGLYRKTYNGYFNDVPTWFASATVTASTADSTLAINPAPTGTSYQYLGYFVARSTETYTFYLDSDDASYLWVGTNAISGFTTANALVNNGGLHGVVEQSGSVALTEVTYYPIRIQFGNNGGGGSLAVYFSTPTIAKTNVFTDFIFYNDNNNGL